MVVVSPRPLWRERRFATYWAGQTFSDVGDRITEIAVPLIAITLLDASPLVVSALTAALWAPQLFGLLIGAWVDRRPLKRRIMIWADVVRGAVLLTVPPAALTGRVSLPLLFAVTVVIGAGAVFFRTAYSTFFVSLVARSDFVQANSLVNATRSGSYVVGPALGGGLVQLLTAPVALVADALSYFASAACLGLTRVDESRLEREEASGTLLRHAWSGLTFIRRHAYLRPILAVAATVNLFSMAGQPLILIFASRHLELSAATIGMALGVGAVGGLLGAVITPALVRRIGAGPSVAVGIVLYSAPLAVLATAGGPYWVKVAVLAGTEFVSAVGVMLFDVVLQSVFVAVTPDRMRSRVSGGFATVNFGVRPLAALAGGAVAQLVGIPLTLVLTGLGGILAIGWMLGTPVIRTGAVEDLEAVEAD